MAKNKPASHTPAEDDGIWGIHPVLEFLKSTPRKVREISIQENKAGKKIQEIITLAQEHNIKTRFLPANRFPGGGTHQGVLAKISPQATLSLDELLGKIKDVQAPLLVALDSIQDPHNLGAIIRSASAAGANGIILPKDRSAPLNATAAKAAAGTMAQQNICVVTNLSTALQKLQKNGYWVYGAAGEAEQSIFASDLSGSACVVIGGEGKGLRPLIREQCDVLLSIPMAASTESLNASVAAGIILFEVVRQRQAKP